MEIESSTPVAVTLTAGQWQQTLGVLGEGPYRIVAPLINEIIKQVQAGAEPGPTRAMPSVGAGLPVDRRSAGPEPNGEDLRSGG